MYSEWYEAGKASERMRSPMANEARGIDLFPDLHQIVGWVVFGVEAHR